MSRFQIYSLSLILLTFSSVLLLAEPAPGPKLTIDGSANRHPISPYIYGIADTGPDAGLANELKWPLNRWGGDAATRYNWKLDMSNSGGDWFFMVQGGNGGPSGAPDKMIDASKGWGGRALITIPYIDYINSATTTDCTFPVSIFGPQQKVNPFVHPTINGAQTDAGNGVKPDGSNITPTKDQIERIHVANTPDYQKEWVRHLVEKYGTTDKGGVALYELDNEPDGWNNTHRDIHPDNLGHDELVNKTLTYGGAVKDADATALVAGPGGFLLHYDNEGKPGDGKAEHGGLGQAEYFLKKMAEADQSGHRRILDYFDEHYYPLDQRDQTDDVLLERTRSLWDPSYVEKDWYGDNNGAVDLIPKFKEWVNKYYPGTKVSISEYGFGEPSKFVTALAFVDVLGIYGREGLDMACLFGSPKPDQPVAGAFRAYLNYDGNGGKFGDSSVSSTSEDQGKLAVYSAVRTSDHVLTVIVLNKTTTDLQSSVSLSGILPKGSAKVYRLAEDSGNKLASEPDQNVKPDGFTATFPARSATLLAIPL